MCLMCLQNTHTHAYMHTCKTTYWVYLLLLTHACVQGWAHGIRQPMWKLIPGKKYFSHFQPPLTTCSSSPRCRTLLDWPHPHWFVNQYWDYIYLIQANYCREFLWFFSLACLGTLSSSWHSGSYNLSTSTSGMFPEPYCRNCITDVSVGVGDHMDTYYLYFDQLWISVFISICCKRMLLRWQVRAILICGYKYKYFIVLV